MPLLQFVQHFLGKQEPMRKSTLLDKVDTLAEQARFEQAQQHEQASRKRFESERLWAESQSHEAEASRLHNLAEKLEELTDSPV